MEHIITLGRPKPQDNRLSSPIESIQPLCGANSYWANSSRSSEKRISIQQALLLTSSTSDSDYWLQHSLFTPQVELDLQHFYPSGSKSPPVVEILGITRQDSIQAVFTTNTIQMPNKVGCHSVNTFHLVHWLVSLGEALHSVYLFDSGVIEYLAIYSGRSCQIESAMHCIVCSIVYSSSFVKYFY